MLASSIIYNSSWPQQSHISLNVEQTSGARPPPHAGCMRALQRRIRVHRSMCGHARAGSTPHPFVAPRDPAPARSQRRLCVAMASTLDVASIRQQHGAVGKYLLSLGAHTLLVCCIRQRCSVCIAKTSRSWMLTSNMRLAGWGQGWVDLLQERVRKGELHATVATCEAAVRQTSFQSYHVGNVPSTATAALSQCPQRFAVRFHEFVGGAQVHCLADLGVPAQFVCMMARQSAGHHGEDSRAAAGRRRLRPVGAASKVGSAFGRRFSKLVRTQGEASCKALLMSVGMVSEQGRR